MMSADNIAWLAVILNACIFIVLVYQHQNRNANDSLMNDASEALFNLCASATLAATFLAIMMRIVELTL